MHDPTKYPELYCKLGFFHFQGFIRKNKDCLISDNQQLDIKNFMLQTVSSIVKRIYEIQSYKLRKKGVKNVLIAYLLLYLYFFQLPHFFKDLWPQNIENKMMFQLKVTICLQILGTVVFSLIYIPGYLGAKCYQKYESEPTLKKPWEKSNWQEMKWKTTWNLLLNYGVIVPLYFYFGLAIAGVSMRFHDFPSSGEIVQQMVVILLADDFIYMCFHRLFHEVPFFYRFHKVHHEYDTVFAAVGQYTHPLEEIFGNLLPGSLIFVFYKVHIFTFFMFQVYKLYNSTQGHSGYDLPWSPSKALPLVYNSAYHNFHHSKNIGNYATSFYLLELIIGTNKTFFDQELAKAKDGQYEQKARLETKQVM